MIIIDLTIKKESMVKLNPVTSSYEMHSLPLVKTNEDESTQNDTVTTTVHEEQKPNDVHEEQKPNEEMVQMINHPKYEVGLVPNAVKTEEIIHSQVEGISVEKENLD